MTAENTTDAAGVSQVEQGVGRLVPKRANARTRPCPNPKKGERCPLCGGAWVCLQSWRPKALASVNRYCRAEMCLKTDAEHEQWCERPQ